MQKPEDRLRAKERGIIAAQDRCELPAFRSSTTRAFPIFAGLTCRRGSYEFKQRVEHFIISTAVDLIVVSLLLWLVGREQRKLRLSEERYRALFEHASDGIAVVKATDRQIIEVNNKFCKLLGYRPQELVKKSIADLVSANGDGSGYGALEFPNAPSY